MLDRASTFANPAIVELLKTRFIPVAIDQAYQRRQRDAEGRFYQKIANQSPRKIGSGTTQGLFVASASGTYLGYTNNRGSERTRRLLQSALDKYQPETIAAIDPGTRDAQYNPEPPSGGLVVRVTSKVLGGYEVTDDPWKRIMQESIGRDNLWVREDETKALIAGQFPESLMSRIARYHLIDNTRGEPPMWNPEEIRHSDVELKEGVIRGMVHLATDSGSRAYRTKLLGFVEVTDGQITRFDMVASGEFRGQGRYTKNAPKGWFPFAVVLTLANGKDIADLIPPQGSRGWVAGYLK